MEAQQVEVGISATLIHTKHRNQENKHHGDQGESVESIMALVFICIRLNNNYETHAYCVKQNHPDKRAKDTSIHNSYHIDYSKANISQMESKA
eukprot:2260219-Heterocapsa_arctica.AAC.1